MASERRLARATVLGRAALMVVVVLGVCVLAGCRGVAREDVVSWREALKVATEQSRATFEATNEQVDRSRFAWLVKQPAISEELVRPALDGASVARWNAALRALTDYATAIELLLAPETSAEVGESVRAVGGHIGDAANTRAIKSDGPLSVAIGRISERLVQVNAGSTARQIMLEADPDVRAVLKQLSDMLLLERGDVRAGVVETIRVTRNNEIATIEEEFRDAPTQERWAVTERYIGALRRRDQSVLVVLSLRDALQSLAATHALVASGRPADARGIVEQMRRDLSEVRALIQTSR